MLTTNIPYQNKITGTELQKVFEVSEKLNIQPAWLMGVIAFETAGSFSPSKTNSIGSVGLIQFTRDKKGVEYKTINGVRYNLADLKNMSFVKQMDVVYEYFKPYKGKINSFIDLYMVTFFPNALNKTADFVLQTAGLSASLIAKQNPIFDTNKNQAVTKGEVYNFFKGWYKDNFSKVNVKQDDLLIQKAKVKGWFRDAVYIVPLLFCSAFTLYEIIEKGVK